MTLAKNKFTLPIGCIDLARDASITSINAQLTQAHNFFDIKLRHFIRKSNVENRSRINLHISKVPLEDSSSSLQPIELMKLDLDAYW